MKVKELLNELAKYNLEANISIVVACRPYQFDISYGTSEGCKPSNCEEVCLSVITNDYQTEQVSK